MKICIEMTIIQVQITILKCIHFSTEIGNHTC